LGGENILEEKRTEIAAMEAEIKELESQWTEVSDELNLNLSRAKRQFDEKRIEIEQKQEKIDFYESNYSRLVQELKQEMSRREYLIEEYKKMSKDTKRESLSEMVFETKTRSKQNEETTQLKKNELKQLNASIAKLDEEIKVCTTEINSKIGEGEDKKKKDDRSFDKLRESFAKLSRCFNETRSYMERLVELQVKNKQLQDRVLDLRRNRYQEITEKLKKDLQEL